MMGTDRVTGSADTVPVPAVPAPSLPSSLAPPPIRPISGHLLLLV